MNQVKTVIFFLIAVLHLSCESKKAAPSFLVSIPTIEQEASSIWRTINDIDFLEKQGYTIHLPQHPLMDSLVIKSKNGSFGNTDFQAIYQVLDSTIYKKEHYQNALEKVKQQEELLTKLIQELRIVSNSWEWDFKQVEPYQITFTLYGTGGSYDPDQGLVTLFTTSEGGFMKYQNPANTIIHEIVHIGIDTSIIQKHAISHALKERIVDRIVSILFGASLPNYQVQNMGNPAIDQYLQKKADLVHLDAVVKGFVGAE